MKYNFDIVNERRGTYCTQWDYIKDRFGDNDLLPFSISDTDFIVPKPISNKLKEVVDHQIYGYTRWNHSDFKEAISSYYLRRFNTKIDQDYILYSPTVMYSLSLLFRLLSNENDKILTFSPMYDAFYNVIQANNRELVEHKLKYTSNIFSIDFNQLENDIKDCKILLLCSPHNPTGRIWTKDEMDQIIALCIKYDVKIISDEIHMDICLKENKFIPLLSYLPKYKQIYTTSSSSKTFNTPGLIGSYAIIPDKEIYDKFINHTRRADFLNSVSIMGMHALMVGYQECDDYIEDLNLYIKENMNILYNFLKDNLSDFQFEIPEGTYLAWINIEKVPFSSEQIQEALIKVGKVAIMKGNIYGNSRFLRMNLGCSKTKLLDGLNRLKKAMDSLYGGK